MGNYLSTNLRNLLGDFEEIPDQLAPREEPSSGSGAQPATLESKGHADLDESAQEREERRTLEADIAHLKREIARHEATGEDLEAIEGIVKEMAELLDSAAVPSDDEKRVATAHELLIALATGIRVMTVKFVELQPR